MLNKKGDTLDKRFVFNEDVENYDKFRPRYCAELFNHIINYAELNSNKSAIEVGIGTGQATKAILETGCLVRAIEIGENLAKYSKNKFSEFDNLEINNISFEDYQYISGCIDLVFSGTAFHWIEEELGYKKAYDMLARGGTLALFWNRPSGGDNKLYDAIQAIYNQYMPKVKPRNNKSEEEVFDERKKVIKKYGSIFGKKTTV